MAALLTVQLAARACDGTAPRPEREHRASIGERCVPLGPVATPFEGLRVMASATVVARSSRVCAGAAVSPTATIADHGAGRARISASGLTTLMGFPPA